MQDNVLSNLVFICGNNLNFLPMVQTVGLLDLYGLNHLLKDRMRHIHTLHDLDELIKFKFSAESLDTCLKQNSDFLRYYFSSIEKNQDANWHYVIPLSYRGISLDDQCRP